MGKAPNEANTPGPTPNEAVGKMGNAPNEANASDGPDEDASGAKVWNPRRREGENRMITSGLHSRVPGIGLSWLIQVKQIAVVSPLPEQGLLSRGSNAVSTDRSIPENPAPTASRHRPRLDELEGFFKGDGLQSRQSALY
jgi:hypothetical protein